MDDFLDVVVFLVVVGGLGPWRGLQESRSLRWRGWVAVSLVALVLVVGLLLPVGRHGTGVVHHLLLKGGLAGLHRL